MLIGSCGYATWRASAIARADWAASAGTVQGFEEALRIDPSDPELVARAAIFRSESDDPAPAIDDELRRASRLNPLNSAVLMTLGLREELQGNRANAERELVLAATVDHQFKPAWTLANYYFRVGEPDKSWVMIQRILSLKPLGFDPSPVFELAWMEAGEAGESESAKAAKIAALIPPGDLSIQYLAFLERTRRTDAAVAAWPQALAAADSTEPASYYLLAFPDLLAAAGRMPDAVRAWNALVERGLVRSGRLAPAQGDSIADPNFQFGAPREPHVFDWRVGEVPGVFATMNAGSFDLEISGDEAPSFGILSTGAALQKATRYRLVWKADASPLNSPHDPGFAFQLEQRSADQGKAETTMCPPLLAAGASACEFTSVADPGLAVINLLYTRAVGTVRVSGMLHLLSVRLEIVK